MTAKIRVFTALLTLIVSTPLQAAAKKADANREALVTAVQAVSPDALGGRLGLEIATSSTPKTQSATPAVRPVASVTDRSTDLASYQAWKRAKKS